MKRLVFRIPTSRIWRAFPELDPFSDEECRKYVREARRRKRLIGILLHVVGAALGLFVGIGIAVGLGYAVKAAGLTSAQKHDLVFMLIAVASMGAIGLCPALGALLLRDFWLRRALRSRLQSAACAACGYTLLGLVIAEDEELGAYVTCPECGTRTALKRAGLTPDDLLADGAGTGRATASGTDAVLSDDKDSADAALYRALVRGGLSGEQARAAADAYEDDRVPRARRCELAAIVVAGVFFAVFCLMAFTDLVPGVPWVRGWVRPIQWLGAIGYVGLLASYTVFLIAHAIAQRAVRSRYIEQRIEVSTQQTR